VRIIVTYCNFRGPADDGPKRNAIELFALTLHIYEYYAIFVGHCYLRRRQSRGGVLYVFRTISQKPI